MAEALKLTDLLEGATDSGREMNSKERRLAAEREEYKRRKRVVAAMEARNTSKLIFFKSMGTVGYWKLIGRSAVYYALFVARKRMKKQVKLIPDTDFFDKSKNGVVSVRGMDKLEEDLKKFEIRRMPFEGTDIRVFDTGVHFDEQTIKVLLKEDDTYREQANKLLLPKVTEPDLYKELRLVIKKAFEQCRKLEPTIRGVATEEILAPVFRANSTYLRAARGKLGEKEAWIRINREVETALVGIKVIFNMGIWEPKTVKEMSESLAKIETLAGAMIKKIERTEEEEKEKEKIKKEKKGK